MDYESSRLGKQSEDDRPADVLTTVVNSTLLLEPGQEVLATSASSGKSTMLLVSIEK